MASFNSSRTTRWGLVIVSIVAPSITGFLVGWLGTFSSAFLLPETIAVAGALAVAAFVKEP